MENKLKLMENKLKRIVNQKVIDSRSGGGAGSILVVKFEDISYLFTWCSWRIENKTDVIVTSSDTIEPTETIKSLNGLIGEKAPILVGLKVTDINISPQYDLDVSFSDGYKLRIFCDIGPSRDDYNHNWEYLIPKENLSIVINNHFSEVITTEKV